MSNSPAPQVERIADMLKVTRTEWVTRKELSMHLGCKQDTVIRWARQLVRQGLLVERMGEKREGVGGYRPMVYALAPEWGGQVGGHR